MQLLSGKFRGRQLTYCATALTPAGGAYASSSPYRDIFVAYHVRAQQEQTPELIAQVSGFMLKSFKKRLLSSCTSMRGKRLSQPCSGEGCDQCQERRKGQALQVATMFSDYLERSGGPSNQVAFSAEWPLAASHHGKQIEASNLTIAHSKPQPLTESARCDLVLFAAKNKMFKACFC